MKAIVTWRWSDDDEVFIEWFRINPDEDIAARFYKSFVAGVRADVVILKIETKS